MSPPADSIWGRAFIWWSRGAGALRSGVSNLNQCLEGSCVSFYCSVPLTTSGHSTGHPLLKAQQQGSVFGAETWDSWDTASTSALILDFELKEPERKRNFCLFINCIGSGPLGTEHNWTKGTHIHASISLLFLLGWLLEVWDTDDLRPVKEMGTQNWRGDLQSLPAWPFCAHGSLLPGR